MTDEFENKIKLFKNDVGRVVAEFNSGRLELIMNKNQTPEHGEVNENKRLSLFGGRASGRTHDILLASSKYGIPITVISRKEEKKLLNQAKKLGIKIPTPVTVLESLIKTGTHTMLSYSEEIEKEAWYKAMQKFIKENPELVKKYRDGLSNDSPTSGSQIE